MRFMSGERPFPHPAGLTPARGLAIIALLGGGAVLYLCLQVRISAVDVACLSRETLREEYRTVIATDMTTLSGLSDTALNLDRAGANHLCEAEERDQVAVSRELCSGAEGGFDPGGEAPAVDSPALAAGLGTY
jgi:hypothetical protein